MTTAQQFPQFTFEDFLDYEDAYGTPFELSADGFLVSMPAPDQEHELIISYLDRLFAAEIERLGHPWFPSRRAIEIPVGGFFKGRRPDLSIIELVPERNQDRAIYQIPKLVIEIASASWSEDLKGKTHDYALLKVPEYWVIDYRGQIPEKACLRGKGIKTIVFTLEGFRYKRQEFLGDEVIPGATFPELALTTSQIVERRR